MLLYFNYYKQCMKPWLIVAHIDGLVQYLPEKIRNLISHLTIGIRLYPLEFLALCEDYFCGFLYPLRFNFGTILSIY